MIDLDKYKAIVSYTVKAVIVLYASFKAIDLIYKFIIYLT